MPVVIIKIMSAVIRPLDPKKLLKLLNFHLGIMGDNRAECQICNS